MVIIFLLFFPPPVTCTIFTATGFPHYAGQIDFQASMASFVKFLQVELELPSEFFPAQSVRVNLMAEVILCWL